MIKTISMSKTIKITPRRKNRSEKGVRAEFFGSNPHSNGAAFSRSYVVRYLRAHAAINVNKVRVLVKIAAYSISNIRRKYYYFLLIKS
jgi:hypothetical protein